MHFYEFALFGGSQSSSRRIVGILGNESQRLEDDFDVFVVGHNFVQFREQSVAETAGIVIKFNQNDFGIFIADERRIRIVVDFFNIVLDQLFGGSHGFFLHFLLIFLHGVENDFRFFVQDFFYVNRGNGGRCFGFGSLFAGVENLDQSGDRKEQRQDRNKE